MGSPRKKDPDFVDDEGQVTPHSDALTENEGSGSMIGLSAADIAAALRSAGVARTSDERGYSRDKVDVDVGMDEFLRFCMANRAASLTGLGNTLDHVKAVKAMDAQTLANFENNANSFFGVINKAGSTFHSNLLQAYGLETDNEVLSTAALTKLIDGLLEDRLQAFANTKK